jgi:hypothetical protein
MYYKATRKKVRNAKRKQIKERKILKKKGVVINIYFPSVPDNFKVT